MRLIFKKLERKQNLTGDEYSQLLQYIEELRSKSPESFMLFFNKYCAILYQDYNTYLPRFTYEVDDFYDYLINNPQLIAYLRSHVLPIEAFPIHLREYLTHTYKDGISAACFPPLIDLINTGDEELVLPRPREKEPVIKYENANPYKEPGLKNHFERIARYSFVSRLQSYRYLRNSKANLDRIYVVSEDSLGGIFTNKEKSIYYYIFLTENDNCKAANACRVLNLALYGRDTGEMKNEDHY